MQHEKLLPNKINKQKVFPLDVLDVDKFGGIDALKK